METRQLQVVVTDDATVCIGCGERTQLVIRVLTESIDMGIVMCGGCLDRLRGEAVAFTGE